MKLDYRNRLIKWLAGDRVIVLNGRWYDRTLVLKENEAGMISGNVVRPERHPNAHAGAWVSDCSGGAMVVHYGAGESRFINNTIGGE